MFGWTWFPEHLGLPNLPLFDHAGDGRQAGVGTGRFELGRGGPGYGRRCGSRPVGCPALLALLRRFSIAGRRNPAQLPLWYPAIAVLCHVWPAAGRRTLSADRAQHTRRDQSQGLSGILCGIDPSADCVFGHGAGGRPPNPWRAGSYFSSSGSANGAASRRSQFWPTCFGSCQDPPGQSLCLHRSRRAAGLGPGPACQTP